MKYIFPIAYFGSIAYYKHLVDFQPNVLEKKEHYLKQTRRNRMLIQTSSGILPLSIPVVKPQGNKTLTENIFISTAENWQKNHWKAIESAYAPAPFFEHYAPEVHALIHQKQLNLLRFNQVIHQQIIDWLQLPIEQIYTEHFESVSERYDRRLNLSPSVKVEKYTQVFNSEMIDSELSILDAIFNLGPMSRKLLINN
jgi:hypothetical protein